MPMNIINRLYLDKPVTAQQIATVLESQDESIIAYLYEKSNQKRMEHLGNIVHIRAIIEFSNYCRCACHYCGLQAKNLEVDRFRMSPSEMIETSLAVHEAGYQTVILQSGEDLFYTKEILGEIVKQILAKTDLILTLSIGERSYEDYAYLRECGANRFLIKHETADPDLYDTYHPHSSFANRMIAQQHIAKLGYELGSGFMIGLPGQTYLTLGKDLLLLKTLQVQMAGIGPYISHPKTELKGNQDGDPILTIKVLAIARLLLPIANLPSTTALNIKGGLTDALGAGANVIMQKATPFAYRNLYDIYPGRECAQLSLKQQLDTLKTTLLEKGYIGI